MDNFDLKNYLKNNTLLNEGVEEKEEVKEEVKTEGIASKAGKGLFAALTAMGIGRQHGNEIAASIANKLPEEVAQRLSDTIQYAVENGVVDTLGTMFEGDEEVKTEGYGKMKKSELKEKIREEILEAMAKDEEPVHEADEDEDIAPEVDADIDVDAELDMEEPAEETSEEDPFGDVEDGVEGAEQEAYDAIIAAGRAYKKLGEDIDNGGLKTMMDQLTYLERSYDYPPKEDVFNTDSEI